MSSDTQELYQAMIKAGFSETEIKKHIETKTNEFQGFITEEGALFLVAKEFGINPNQNDIDSEDYENLENDIDYDEFLVPISKITVGVSNIVVLGRIVRVFPPKEFARKDGTTGLVGSFTITDGADSIKVVLWDEKTKVMNNEYFKFNEVVRIIGGYSKENRDKLPEIHIGNKGKVVLDPKNINSRLISLEISEGNTVNANYSVGGKIDKIEEIESKEGFIKSISGSISSIDFQEIKKKDGDMTFLLKFVLVDDTSIINVNVWGNQAIEFLKIIDEGKSFTFSSVALRYNSFSQQNEINFTRLTRIAPAQSTIV